MLTSYRWNRLLTRRRLVLVLTLVVVISQLVIFSLPSDAAPLGTISLTTPDVAKTENFNGLAVTGTTNDSSTMPTAWDIAELGTNANTTYSAGNGGGNAGDTYSFGSIGSGDRALGELSSGSLQSRFGARFTNNTGGTITSVDISYTGEQWRSGDTTNVPDRIDFQISTNATSLTTGTWTDVDALDFSSVQTTLAAGALDGNNPANRALKSSTISSLNVANGASFWIRWVSVDISGSDDGLAVDDFSLTPHITGPTNPAGIGAASPNYVAPTGPTLLTVTVTPGTFPTSTGLAVSANLSAIGGSANQAFVDNGTGGDATAGDNIFSFSANVANGTSGGSKNLPFTITDAQGRSGNGSISLTVLATTNPSGTGASNPASVLPGDVSVLAVAVTPGTNPTSTGLAVIADLSSIGGSATQMMFDDGSSGGDLVAGNNTFTYTATVANATTPGAKSLPFTITDAQGRSASGSISLTVQQPPPPVDHIVISQIYGGGNTGATYTNDYVELYNPTGISFNLAGWSLQYGSATGTTWTNKQPLGGTIAPGEYFLVSLASGGAVGAPLPVSPNISGDINMSASAGKVALVNNSINLAGACPIGVDPDIVDFIGYGTTANCWEGTGRAPGLNNVTADFRKLNGSQDTNQNSADFQALAPNPRRTAPIVELGPWVAGTEPITDAAKAPYDSTISVDFSEPVDVVGNWYDITCTMSGQHNSATVASYAGFKGYHITPNNSFEFGEQCTVTIFHGNVHDQDLDDSNPNTDTLFADYSWSFTVVEAGTPPPYPSSVHLTMGNPSNAVADLQQFDNYLMEKPTYAVSYNRDKGTPNWVSWHLEQDWFGNLARMDTFRADPALPPDWYRVQSTDYFASGFDRGHMTPNADRDNENRVRINQETYLMTNMVPQAPDNNQGPWGDLENDLRTLLNGTQNEMYIISGPLGVGGSGSNGGITNTLANGQITVPAFTWKVVLILPKGDNDVSRVTAGTTTIAVMMPNVQGIRNNDWHQYLTTVDAVEQATGYDFFANVPDAIENAIEAGTNGINPPGTEGQAVTTDEDTPKNITLTAVGSNGPLTYSIINPPAHGNLTGSAENRTFNPDADFNGSDSFTFRVSDGNGTSNISTVNITVTEVNDTPTVVDDEKSATEDTDLVFPASELTANDNAGPSNESAQLLTVTDVAATANTHGVVSLNSGTITYSPAANYNGPASFQYTVCDDGTTSGAVDFKCTTGAVNLSVAEVNDGPSAGDDSKTTDEDQLLSFASSDLLGNDSPGPANENGQSLTVNAVTATADTHGSVSLNNGTISYLPEPNYNGAASFAYEVCDNGTTDGVLDAKCVLGTVHVTINPQNDAPSLSGVPANATIDELAAYGFTASASDIDLPAQPLTFSLVGAPGGASINPLTGAFSWTPSEAQGGTGVPFVFKVRVSDGVVNTDADITLNVNEINQPPTLNAIGNKTVLLGDTLTFTASGADADLPAQSLSFSLIDAPAGATINPNTGAFSWTPTAGQVGQIFTFKVRITDNGSPTLYGEEQINVGVGYTWSGLLAPIQNGGLYKAGRTIPIKFQLTGSSAGITNAVVRLLIFRMNGSVPGDPVEVRSTSAPTNSNLFRYSGDGYIFNLDTSSMSAGTYQLQIDLGDGVMRACNISLR